MEKRRIDLEGAGVRVVNVALILQGIREGAVKRRKPGQVVSWVEFSDSQIVWLRTPSNLDGSTSPHVFVSVADKGVTLCVSAVETYSCGSRCKC